MSDRRYKNILPFFPSLTVQQDDWSSCGGFRGLPLYTFSKEQLTNLRKVPFQIPKLEKETSAVDRMHAASLWSQTTKNITDDSSSSSGSDAGYVSADSPMDLSKKSTQTHCTAPSPEPEATSKPDFTYTPRSMLKELLSNTTTTSTASTVAPQKLKRHAEQDVPLDLSATSKLLATYNTTSEAPAAKRACPDYEHSDQLIDMMDAVDNPVQAIHLAYDSRVTLSTKFSSALAEVMCRLYSCDYFCELSEEDKVNLVYASWHRLLLWIMAKDNCNFKVVRSSYGQLDKVTRLDSKCRAQPTMAFVKTIATFYTKYKALKIDEEEMTLLFLITAFHSGHAVSINHAGVDRMRRQLMGQLEAHCKKTSNADPGKRYVELLMFMPTVYGVDEGMFEYLFCKKLVTDGDIRVILKETLKKLVILNQSAKPLSS